MTAKKGYKAAAGKTEVEALKELADGINEKAFTIKEIITVLESAKKIDAATARLDLFEN
jgi:hypothetical protein